MVRSTRALRSATAPPNLLHVDMAATSNIKSNFPETAATGMSEPLSLYTRLQLQPATASIYTVDSCPMKALKCSADLLSFDAVVPLEALRPHE